MKRDTFLTSGGNLHVFCDSKSPYGRHLGPNTQAASLESLTSPSEKFVWSRMMYFGSLVHFFPSAISLAHTQSQDGLGDEPFGQAARGDNL